MCKNNSNCKCQERCRECEGCKIKVESFSCVVYDGIPLPGLNIQTGDNLESVMLKLNKILLDINNQL